jgi:hypothetical protein
MRESVRRRSPAAASATSAAADRLLRGSVRIGARGDKYEQEADRVADHVVRLPFSAMASGRAVPPAATGDASPKRGTLQAKAVSNGSCASAPQEEEEPEEEGPMAQRKERAQTLAPIPPRFSSLLHHSTARGERLPPAARSDMEGRFGHRFDQVRIHTDREAVNLTRQLDAEAFTFGNHIYFGSGRYAPAETTGKRLLAHELTHVVQQSSTSRTTIGPLGVSKVESAMLQGYELKGFPPAKERQMHRAVATAISTISGCDYLTWLGKLLIKSALRRLRYDYVPDLGHCGWTFPASWYVEVGESAFDHSRCCDLASTLAHEASHTEWYTESRAREMECQCFNCSC